MFKGLRFRAGHVVFFEFILLFVYEKIYHIYIYTHTHAHTHTSVMFYVYKLYLSLKEKEKMKTPFFLKGQQAVRLRV